MIDKVWPQYIRIETLGDEKMAKCPVCGMMGKPHIKSVYKGKTFYFMSPQHKEMFDANPEKFNLEVGLDE
ncbi:MAG: YHS domain-containing protein [Candidatus Thorarchaeota archaeon]|jgi:YHS domain-containing protein